MVGTIRFTIFLMLFVVEQGSWGAAQDATPVNPPLTSESVQVLNEEALDEISLNRTIFFTTPEGTDAIAPAGFYRVVGVDPARLRLISANGGDALLIQALVMHHQEKFVESVALSIPAEEDTHHVVLLLPNGQGLDAVGSYSAVRPRGWNPTPVLLEWIEKALTQKEKPIRKDEKKGGH
jgi:hypothetical protein